MDYTKHYNSLILKAQSRPFPEGYTEKHHIIPRCLGGSNAKANIAILTGREHFVAHLLLRRMYPNHIGLALAIVRMIYDVRRITNSRKYEWVKKECFPKLSEHNKKHALKRWEDTEYQKEMSEMSKRLWSNPEHVKLMREKNSGINNPQFGKKLSEDERRFYSRSSGVKPFKAWRAICIKPDSYKGIGIYEKGEFLGIFQNRSEFSRKFYINRPSIAKCLNKKSPQTGGFLFEFVE
jgi:hypothetical protein